MSGVGAVRGLAREVEELAAIIDSSVSPTVEQQHIIGADSRPALVVAGAGSGKTETLSMRMVYLLDHAKEWWGEDLTPDRLLCLTFTRKAAREIAQRCQRRIEAVFGPDPDRPQPAVMTYNAYGAQLVAEHGIRVGLDPQAAVATSAALWQISAQIVESWTADLDIQHAPSTLIGAVPRLSQQLREHGVTTDDLRTWIHSVQAHVAVLPKRVGDSGPASMTLELSRYMNVLDTLLASADVVDAFDARKVEMAVSDFADQVSGAVQLAQFESVQAVERSRYVAVLLDEFQDTSPAQLRLFTHMFGTDHCVMAVGDPHQAIYGFRGASAAALTDFVEAYGGERHVQTLGLSVSWRNPSEILTAANASTQVLRDAPGVPVAPLMSADQATGRVTVARAWPAISAMMCDSLMEEADAVVEFLVTSRQRLDEERPTEQRDTPITAAVLCRKRRQFAAIADACRRANVAFQIVGLGGLIDEPDIADVIALLEVAHDPARGDALMRLLVGERMALGPRDVMAWGEWARELSGPRDELDSEVTIVDALAHTPPIDWVSREGRSLTQTARNRLADLAQVVDAIRRHTYLPVPELVVWTHRAWGLDIESEVARAGRSGPRAIDAFVDAAHAFSATSHHSTVGAFLSWLSATRAEEDGLEAPVHPPDPDAIQILTVHAAKGLEWDVVAVAGVVEGTFPSVGRRDGEYASSGWMSVDEGLPWDLRMDRSRLPSWQWSTAKDHQDLARSISEFRAAAGAHEVDEERRLFYVAVTRAKAQVFLTGAWRGTGVRVAQPSLFLAELVDRGIVSTEDWAPAPDDGDRVSPPVAPPVDWPTRAHPAQERRREFAHLVAQAMEVSSTGTSELSPASDRLADDLPLAGAVRMALADHDDRVKHAAEVWAPTHMSTSAMVALRSDPEAYVAEVRRPMPTAPTAAAARGSALHAWIERHYGHMALIADDLDDDLHDPLLESAMDTFATSEWAGRQPVAIEVPIDLTIAGVVVRSRIDAVFPVGNGLDRVTVVDWKSGTPPRDPLARQAREVQLAVYRLAWASITNTPVDEVDAAFYYVADDATVRPQALLGLAELEDMVRGAYAVGSDSATT